MWRGTTSALNKMEPISYAPLGQIRRRVLTDVKYPGEASWQFISNLKRKKYCEYLKLLDSCMHATPINQESASLVVD